MTGLDRLTAALDGVRTDDRRRRLATAVGLTVGLGFAWVHWLGLVAGGALVAVPRRRFLTAPVAGLGFGALVLVVFGLSLSLAGSLGAVLGMGRITLVAVGAGLGLPIVGALVRGVA